MKLISFQNIQLTHMYNKYVLILPSFRLNSTTDNNHDDDASTLNGDISLSSAINDDVSTIHEDGDSDSTLNGSVVNAEDNSKHSDQWINSLSRTKDTKEMKVLVYVYPLECVHNTVVIHV